jgi:hypothetical protein
MKNLIFFAGIMFLSAQISNAQIAPAQITKYLNAKHAGWTKAPGFCQEKKWFLPGDFNGDRQTDYIVRFKTGKKTPRLQLYAFVKKGRNYLPLKISADAYNDNFRRSSFSIIKKGTTVSLGQGEEGEGPTMKLKTDAVTQYICETDAAITYVYKNGRFTNIAK